MITLTPAQEAGLLHTAKTELVAHLIKHRGKDLELLSPLDVSALLGLDRRTWEKSIPRVVIAPGTYRYQAADVAKFIEDRKEKS